MQRRTLLALAGALPLAACGVGKDPMADQTAQPGGGSLIIGSANFTESQVLAELYAGALTAKGLKPTVKHGIGSREVYLKALRDGSISVIAEYGGNLLQYLASGSPATDEAAIEAALRQAVAPDLAVLAAAQAANQDVYCVTKAYADANGLASLADLKKVSGQAILGGPAELKDRPYGPVGMEAIYRTTFAEFRTYDSLAVKVKDLTDGKVQVATFFTTDAAIADNGLVQLTDPQQMILPQQVIPLVRADVAKDATAKGAIEAVQAQLSTADLTQLNKQVDTEHLTAKQAAAGWLKAKGLG